MSPDLALQNYEVSAESTGGKPTSIAMESAFCCVARFSAGLAHQSKVAEALQHFCDAFGLTKIAIYRSAPGDPTPRRIAHVGNGGQSYAEFDALATLSEQENPDTGLVQQIDTVPGATVLFIILQVARSGVDIMQLNLPTTADQDRISSLTAMAPAMAMSWRMRQPGLASALVFAQTRTRRTQQSTTDDRPILSPENAYGLSRSEFRVCRLLATGLKPQIIASELGLSIATIRSHLRNIYAKTDMAGQIEVVSHIGRSEQPMMQAA